MTRSLLFVFCLVAASCSKETSETTSEKTFTVEGNIFSSRTSQPVSGVQVAVGLNERPADQNPASVTDSDGHFIIIHQFTAARKLMLYSVPNDLNCLTPGEHLVKGFEGGTDRQLGTIYTQ